MSALYQVDSFRRCSGVFIFFSVYFVGFEEVNLSLVVTQITISCSKSTKKNTRKSCEICSNLTIKISE